MIINQKIIFATTEQRFLIPFFLGTLLFTAGVLIYEKYRAKNNP